MDDATNRTSLFHSYKLKVDACERGSKKELQLRNLTVNYLYVYFFTFLSSPDHSSTFRYRYGTLIVFANYLIEMRERAAKAGAEVTFENWLEEHREITNILGRRSLN
jgi:hypothetical protein